MKNYLPVGGAQALVWIWLVEILSGRTVKANIASRHEKIRDVSHLALRELRHQRNWRTAATMIGILNLLSWLTLFVMHKTGVLVEYGEFLQHMRSMRH